MVLCVGLVFYTGGMIKDRNGFSLGDKTSVDTWASQCSISFAGIITTSGSRSATGSIEGGTITTASGHISSLSGDIQARNETVGIKKDHFKYLLHWVEICTSTGIKRDIHGARFRRRRWY